MTQGNLEAFNEQLKAMYDDPMYRSMTRMWGENINLGYFESPEDNLAEATRRANSKLARAAGLEPCMEILEVACGVGGASRYAVRHHGVRAVATNLSRDQLDIARELTEEAIADRISYEYADFHDLPYLGARFDVWWCATSVFHAVNKPRVLREALRVLRPGGRLVLTELTVSESVEPDRRTELSANAHSPGLWSAEHYDAQFEQLGFQCLEREDLSERGVWAWNRLPLELERLRPAIESDVGSKPLDATIERYRMWQDAAAAGEVGYFLYVMRKPEAGR